MHDDGPKAFGAPYGQQRRQAGSGREAGQRNAIRVDRLLQADLVDGGVNGVGLTLCAP